MATGGSDLKARVIAIVAETLSVDPADVHPHSSLLDDLGAESIDFLDLLFRLETAFQVDIPEEELWLGSIDPADLDNPEAIQRAIDDLKVRMPQFRWSALPAQPTRHDLPRLITVQTILDYLERHGAGAAQSTE